MYLPNFLNHNTDSEDSMFRKILRNIDLIIGNDKDYNCQKKGYRMTFTLSVLTLYLVMFTLGLFAGDLSVTQVVQVEKIFGLFSTIAVYVMGFSIIYDCFKHDGACPGKFPAAVSLLTILTQTAFVFNFFPLVYTHVIYYIGSVATMAFVFGYVHTTKMSMKNSPYKNDKQSGFLRFWQ